MTITNSQFKSTTFLNFTVRLLWSEVIDEIEQEGFCFGRNPQQGRLSWIYENFDALDLAFPPNLHRFAKHKLVCEVFLDCDIGHIDEFFEHA